MDYIVDALGDKITVNNYQRIISAVPSITETLFDFGMGSKVVGVTKFYIHPTSAMNAPRTIIGGTKSIQVDKIKILKPDLIIVNKEENSKKRVLELIEDGFNVFVTYPQTVEEGVSMMKDLYYLLNINNQSIYDKFIQDTVDLISTINNTVIDRSPKVFCPVWKDPWMSINKSTFIHSMIELCGGRNIFSEHGDRYPKVTISEIKQHFPDLIILPDEPYIFSNEHVIELKKILGEKNIFYQLINGSYLSWYGSRMIKGIQMLSEYISKFNLR